MARVFVLNGHPAERSLSRSLATAYAEAARLTGHTIRLTHLNDMAFDSDFGYAGYKHLKPLEPSLEEVLRNLEWCEHFVLVTPMWWGGLPAKLKGLFDRILLPGRAFDPREKQLGLPKPLFHGRSARVFVTSDTPGWFLRLVYANALFHQLRGQILHLVGIRPVRITHFAGATHAKPTTVERWLAKARRLGTDTR